MKIDFAIMAVQERYQEAICNKRIIATSGGPCKIYWDSKRQGNWWNAKRIWKEIPDSVTHRVLLQDDGVLCNNFVEGVKAVVAARRDVAISLFSGRKQIKEAAQKGQRWVEFTQFIGGLCVILPRWMAVEFMEFTAESSADLNNDDTWLREYMTHKGLKIHCPCPSFVQHGGVGTSTVGHTGMTGGRPYLAPAWMGLERDPVDFDWTQP